MAKLSSSTIQKVLEQAKKAVDAAEDRWNRGKEEVDRLTQNSLDIYSSGTMDKAKQIAKKIGAMSSDLYLCYQQQIEKVDKECRKLLNDNTTPYDLFSVLSFVKEINESSEIDVNLNLGFDFLDYDSNIEVNFHATDEGKAIQRFWQNKYDSHPDVEKRDKEEKERREAFFGRTRKAQEEFEEQKNKEIDELSQQITELSKQLNSLGFFKFSEKNSIKSKIYAFEGKIKMLRITEFDPVRKERYRQELKNRVKRKRIKPDDEKYMEALILELLADAKCGLMLSEIMEILELEEMIKVSRLMRQLSLDGVIIRRTKDEKVYFSIA